ncbi:MAG: hypothetical protein AAGI69_10645 [Cyanobacteria bacterium P01_H01_bin.21]
MKFYWLSLLVLSAHLSAFTPKALASAVKTPAEINERAEQKDWDNPRASDTALASEKGLHRRRFGRSQFRSGRFRGDIFFRNGSIHRTQFRHGEFRRDDIFFRHNSIRRHHFRHDRFRHNDLRRHDFRHHRFRHHDFYRIRVH